MLILNLNISARGVYFQDKNGIKLSLSSSLKKIINRFFSVILDFKIFIMAGIGNIPSHIIRRYFFKLAGIKMGKNSTFHVGARFYEFKNITIGSGTIIGYRSFIDGRDKVYIGSNTDIASEVMIYNSEHNLSDPNFDAIIEPVSIGDYCFIGPRVIIMPGVTIGDGAIVAGGAVVTKNIPPHAIYGGVPAKEIGIRKVTKHHYNLGRPKLFQ